MADGPSETVLVLLKRMRPCLRARARAQSSQGTQARLHRGARPVNGHRYIRLEIKSAIVSWLNELSHAYAYSRSSGLVARACAGHARTRAHTRSPCGSVSTRAWGWGGGGGGGGGGGEEEVEEEDPWVGASNAVLRAFTGTKIQVPGVQGSIGVRPSDPGTYSPHPHTDA